MATIQYLLVGGAGNGGSGNSETIQPGGGGHGGEVKQGSNYSILPGTYPVVIGNYGSPGGNTTFDGITAVGRGTASYETNGTGDNVTSSISGTSKTYSVGGTKGGVIGGSNPSQPAAQTPNTGNGGTGADVRDPSGATAAGGLGGSGVAVFRYETGSMSAIGGTITTDGSYTVHTFTSSGDFVVSEGDMFMLLI